MSNAIRVELVSKTYQLGQIGTGTLARDLERWWTTSILGREDPFLRIGETNDRTRKGKSDIIWALRDVSFEVKQGEVLGIIGRNGAGKSTLLKILSRTTTPSRGTVKIKGRMASLLEVGTGFHPELTGRENIFLNGAILGMRKSEIRSRFDEIVDFSGVERYIDTPVKRYSSGMYVRLAFAVAAHLEPEILVVDEVLAVGDAEFQRKCLGKMKDVSISQGRTVLFVSHNMGAVLSLCKKGLLLHSGMVNMIGPVEEVVETYVRQDSIRQAIIDREHDGSTIRFLHVYMTDSNRSVKRSEFRYDEEISMFLELSLPSINPQYELALRLIDRYQRGVFTIHEPLMKFYTEKGARVLIKIAARFLTPGRYSWIMCVNDPGIKLYDLQENACSFSVIDTGSEFARYEGMDYGCVFAQYSIDSI